MKNKNLGVVLVLVSLFFTGFPTSLRADEQTVRSYFADVPAMIDIARCESDFRQHAHSGDVLRGGASGKMIGVFQLHGDYHLSPAQSMGMDITTLDGNLAYARHLYSQEGLTPWKPCLGSVKEENMNPVNVTQASSMLSQAERAKLEKKIEELQAQVYMLQIELLKMQLTALGGSY